MRSAPRHGPIQFCVALVLVGAAARGELPIVFGELAKARPNIWIPMRVAGTPECVRWTVYSRNGERGLVTNTRYLDCVRWSVSMKFESEGKMLTLVEPHTSYTDISIDGNHGGSNFHRSAEPRRRELEIAGIDPVSIRTSAGTWYRTHQACEATLRDGLEPPLPLFEWLAPMLAAAEDPIGDAANQIMAGWLAVMKNGSTVYKLENYSLDLPCAPWQVRAENLPRGLRLAMENKSKEGSHVVNTHTEFFIDPKCAVAVISRPSTTKVDLATEEETLPPTWVARPPRRYRVRVAPDGAPELDGARWYASHGACEAARRRLRMKSE